MATVPPMWPWLLSHAVLAPSHHNVQPWRVRITSEREAELWIELARTLPNEDVTGSFIILSMGLFVETLRLVAAHRGLAVEDDPVHAFSWFAAENLRRQPGTRVPFAQLRLREAAEIGPEYSLDLLGRRRTSRLRYAPDPITPEAAAALVAVAGRWGHRYDQATDVARIERILRLNVDAVFEDLNHAPYRDEIASWIRYSRRASRRHRDGLDAACMNVAPLELWLTFHAPWLLRGPFRPWFAHRYRKQIGPVATLGALSGPFWDPRDAYQAGRLLIRFWLECTRLGLFIHPFGNLVTNRPIAERVRAELGIQDTWLMFKIGKSAVPPQSRRRSVKEILID